jgi:hypothetical protein
MGLNCAWPNKKDAEQRIKELEKDADANLQMALRYKQERDKLRKTLGYGSPWRNSNDIKRAKELEAENKRLVDDFNYSHEKKKELKEALEDMCYQFAGWAKGGYTTNGLSALEGAFAVLGWDDPMVCKEAQCDEPGCTEQRTCGFPTDKGYRNTCGKHAKF